MAVNYRAVAAQDAARYLGPQYVQMFLRQINQESGFNPAANSGQAQGIAQFTPATAAEYGVNRFDPISSLAGAAKYDARLLHEYGTMARALSAYNSGRPDAYLDPSFAGGQTYNYVRSILGGHPATAGGAPAPPSPAAAAPASTPAVAGPSLGIPLAVQQILNANNEAAGVGPVNYGALPATPAASPAPTPTAPSQPVAHPSMGVKYTGTPLTGVKQPFLNKVTSAARARGATKIRVISGYRSPTYNARVGGVPRSNHMTGDAIDAEGYVPGRGWVPLGTLLKPVADRYGLRSGDQPGFYRGGPDPNHVDDGANQR